MWRTSWLSREVIVLPLFMAGLFAWGAAHALGLPVTPLLGAGVVLLCIALFVCTAMIYASIKFLREWASPLTLVNYTLLGCASGYTLATVLASWLAPALLRPYALTAALLTAAGLATRALSLRRNVALKPKSTLQTALGIKHPLIEQKSQGFMGGSFNTREFFHGRPALFLRNVKWLSWPSPSCCRSRCSRWVQRMHHQPGSRWPSRFSTPVCWRSAGTSSRRPITRRTCTTR